MAAMQSSDLSAGETLIIDRRRRGESQADAARRHRVSSYRYRRWEDDDDPDAPRVELETIEEYEAFHVLRRRAGMLIEDLAAEIGCSRWWVTQMERGQAPCGRLKDYWRANSRPWRPRVGA